MSVRVMLVRDGRPPSPNPVDNPQAVYRLLKRRCQRADREYLWRIDLDARSRAIDIEVVSIGTLSASLIHPREVWKGAILANAAGIIVAHCHPSGDCSPSEEDRAATRRLKAAGDLVGIPLLDHVIVTAAGYFSFKEQGLL